MPDWLVRIIRDVVDGILREHLTAHGMTPPTSPSL
jgi:hypothetical protein